MVVTGRLCSVVQKKRGKKGFSKSKNQLSGNGFRTYRSEKNAGSDYSGHEDRGKERK